MRKLLILILMAVVAPGADAAGYPRVVKKFKEFDRFPAKVAGYVRGMVVEDLPEMSAYTVAYDRWDSEVQSAVTLYIKPRPADVTAEAQGEEAAIINAHANTQVESRRSIVIKQGDTSYDATLVSFQYDEVFARTRQRVSSLLVLSYRTTYTFKVRASAPVAQAAAAESAMLKLLESIRPERPAV